MSSENDDKMTAAKDAMAAVLKGTRIERANLRDKPFLEIFAKHANNPDAMAEFITASHVREDRIIAEVARVAEWKQRDPLALIIQEEKLPQDETERNLYLRTLTTAFRVVAEKHNCELGRNQDGFTVTIAPSRLKELERELASAKIQQGGNLTYLRGTPSEDQERRK